MNRRDISGLLIDLLAVLIFAAFGRASHEESVLGAPLTALPFWIGLGAGWWLVRSRSGRSPIEVGPGVTVWVTTLVLGMLLRVITGQGTALAFVVVATLVLGVLLVGWRLAQERTGFLPAAEPAHAPEPTPAATADDD